MHASIILLFSYWSLTDKAVLEPVKTCVNEQSDGTCENVQVPSCEDRRVMCSALPNPNGVGGTEDMDNEFVRVELKKRMALDTLEVVGTIIE